MESKEGYPAQQQGQQKLNFHREVSFYGGQISLCLPVWETLTSDPNLLSIIQGDQIEFHTPPPITHAAFNPKTNPYETLVIDNQISSMLENHIIVPSSHEEFEYVSPIFVTPKKDDSYRLILNLKKLNEFVAYEHFKMESIKSIGFCITPNCFMSKIDLKDAYYSVRIHPDSQRYLKFSWRDALFQFVCFPNGLSSCPRCG